MNNPVCVLGTISYFFYILMRFIGRYPEIFWKAAASFGVVLWACASLWGVVRVLTAGSCWKGFLEEGSGCVWWPSVHVQGSVRSRGFFLSCTSCTSLEKHVNIYVRITFANQIYSFPDRRLNSTQGEIRVGPSHQVKCISAVSLIGLSLLSCWPFILLSSNLELTVTSTGIFM